ncbi:MAG TPA: flagella basal body P-ring formation protein FlgA [Caulobacterales bacterium]|nr:flagella basal body P-ring formation protein FlgA [Caulobacterales bacterium]
MMRRLSALACFALLLCAAPAFADTTVTLKPRIESTGAAITLGDVFNGAGDVASRPIAPAPAAGQVTTLSAEFVAAAAAASGLNWSPPAGLTSVRITHPAGARAFVAAERPTQTSSTSTSEPIAASGGDIAVHRGETALLTFDAPGVSLSMQARATSDGAVGQTIRFLNTSSNRPVDAVVTGPGAARVGTP